MLISSLKITQPSYLSVSNTDTHLSSFVKHMHHLNYFTEILVSHFSIRWESLFLILAIFQSNRGEGCTGKEA